MLRTLFLAVVFAACTRKSTPTEPAPAPAPVVATVDAAEIGPEDERDYDYARETFGDLRVGLDVRAVEQRLGAPAAKSSVQQQAADGTFVTTWEWPAKGVILGLAADTADGPFAVRSMSIVAPSALRTSKGVGLGATADDIKRAYGAAHTHPVDDGLVVGSIYGGILFVLEGGKTTSIFVGAGAE
jgi:hypothetical protein